MKDNYRAWDIDFSEFGRLNSQKERMRFLLKFAVLAPSSHNSQPWNFACYDEAICVFTDESLRLPASDVRNRQLFISLGCALENILTAADYYHLESVSLDFDSVGTLMWFRAGGVDGTASVIPSENHLALSIPKRATDRGEYNSRSPERDFIKMISGLASKYGVSLNAVYSPEKEQIADVVVNAMGQAMADKNFRRELSRYIKPNNTDSKVGMPGTGLGMPGPVSLLAPFLIRYVNMSKLTGKKDLQLLKEHTPAFLVISSERDDKTSWLMAGRFCQRVLLEAERSGLRTAPMAAPIEIGEYYRDLQRIMGITSRPQVFMRIGYSGNQVVHSPRLTVEDVFARYERRLR